MKTDNSDIGVCMIKSLYHPYVGGAEKQVERLSKELSLHGVKVFLITRHAKGLPRFEIISEVPVYRVPAYGEGLIASLSFFFFSLIALFKKRREYRIIHAHVAYTPAAIAVIGAKLFGKRCLVKIARGEQWGEVAILKRSIMGRQVLRLLRKYMDVFVAISKDIEIELDSVGIPNSRIRYIPNGVDTGEFRPLHPEEKLRQRSDLGVADKFIVSFTGRLDPIKGLEVLLEAWKDVVSENPNAHLFIIGTGPQKMELITYASEAGISKHVEFVGKVQDVRAFLGASDIFVLPSLSEGVSNALLEAMATELPVIATSVGGTKELIKDGINGILIPPKDSGAISRSITRLMDEGDLRTELGKKARDFVLKNYELETTAQMHVDLYSRILDRGLWK